MIEGYKFQSEVVRRFFAYARAAGEDSGKRCGERRGERKGKRRGERNGKPRGSRDAVLALARIKLEVVAEGDVAAIGRCTIRAC